ncbi:ABC transporter permease [Cupriavidus basilensis]|uniref:ABC transporter permease n=1 Tax=Cupriavidus basilensis TaxID=68895 RepID=UPI0023E79252|nr:ABC transporter permease [Cupriavidus basilensis]MDF3886550.1 ABC transporter permease [Cupriavidus basilensis]
MQSIRKVGSRREFPATFGAMITTLLSQRSLIWQLSKREVVGRYRGSFMGVAWSFFNPLFLLTIYTFVFSFVFKARWGHATVESRSDFAIILFVGMIVHGIFAESIGRAPGLIVSNANYVKRVIFPLEIIPVSALLSSVFHACISLLVLLVAEGLLRQFVPWTALLLPLILLPLLFATLGISWFMASVGVYVRDLGQITGILITVLLFLSPVFYPISSLPERFRGWLYVNPLTFVIEEARKVLIFGQMPNWAGLLAYSVGSILIAWGGYWWFQRTRKGFADVL